MDIKDVSRKRSPSFDARNQIMLVDPLFANRVKLLQDKLNKELIGTLGIGNSKKPVTQVMITKIIAERIRVDTLKLNLRLDLKI